MREIDDLLVKAEKFLKTAKDALNFVDRMKSHLERASVTKSES